MMRRFLSFLSGALMGGLVGATLAILLAPASGEDVRNEIKARSLRLRDEVNKAMADRRAELEEQLRALKAPRKSTPE
ncbi:MAG: YtxH domain-containing protein [Anaerolineales bacterium]|nr:YtxH domain-containing protein [Anaerolineales bacterium]